MIDIRIEGYSVDLEPATALVLTLRNPMFDFSQLPGSYVLDFSLPVTPRNRRIFGYVEHAQAGSPKRRYFCEKYVDSHLIERGYVRIKGIAGGKYSFDFTQDLRNAFGDYQPKLLSAIDFGSIALPVPTTATNYLTDAFCWPMIENAGFYGNNAGISGFNGYMNAFNVGGSGTFDSVARVPMLYLRWLMTQYGSLTGWTFQGDFCNDAILKRLLLYNLYSLDSASGMAYKNHLPDVTMPQLLVGLRNLFNLFFEFDLGRKHIDISFVEDIMTNAQTIDWSMKVSADQPKQPDLQNRLQLDFSTDSSDALLKPVPADLDSYITSETAINAGGSPLPIRTIFSTLDKNSASGRARTSQAGISPNNKDSKTGMLPKLLLWNGIVSGEPRATNDHAGVRLAWHGSNNLVDSYWSAFERFKGTTFSQTRKVYLSPADLAGFSFKKRVHIKGVDYWVGNMKVVLQANARVLVAEAELWKA